MKINLKNKDFIRLMDFNKDELEALMELVDRDLCKCYNVVALLETINNKAKTSK